MEEVNVFRAWNKSFCEVSWSCYLLQNVVNGDNATGIRLLGLLRLSATKDEFVLQGENMEICCLEKFHN